MGETLGQRRDRQRELRALEVIAAALALPHLRSAGEQQTFGEEPDPKLTERIRRAEATVGILRPTKED